MRYQFIVAGSPSDRVAAAFPQLTVQPASDLGGMSLHGELTDQAAVRAVISTLDDLGLTLLELRQIPA
ncbi:hypothetical protein [Humibacillus xanthopallidus]|uniref:Uncharacterized protein n=1 Tax=Humibacillus xanthopallidus TaxID=412689 RepID=A0A543HHR8_9MICO|nr:hypothetical protein [Humibacillus xanthopallidus]TQM57873.1 hypothetical protein FBY41_3209 [Humibacillus xanthopallidus]